MFEHDKQVACVYHNEMGNIIDGAVINAHPFQIEIVEPLKPTLKKRHCLDRNCIDDVTLELPEIKHKPSTVIITEVRAVVVDCLVDISRVSCIFRSIPTMTKNNCLKREYCLLKLFFIFKDLKLKFLVIFLHFPLPFFSSFNFLLLK